MGSSGHLQWFRWRRTEPPVLHSDWAPSWQSVPLVTMWMSHLGIWASSPQWSHPSCSRMEQTWASQLGSESESHSIISNSLRPHGLYSPWNSPGQNTGVVSLSLLQGIFSTQGSNPGLAHCRRVLYQLNHKGSPRVLECIAYPFSRRSSQPRNQTRASCIASRFFTNWAIREALNWVKSTTGQWSPAQFAEPQTD